MKECKYIVTAVTVDMLVWGLLYGALRVIKELYLLHNIIVLFYPFALLTNPMWGQGLSDILLVFKLLERNEANMLIYFESLRNRFC